MPTATIAPQQQAVLDVLATHALAPEDTVNVHPTGVEDRGYVDIVVRDSAGQVGGTIRLWAEDPEEGLTIFTFDARGANTSHGTFSTGSGINHRAVTAYAHQLVVAMRAAR